MQVPNSTILTWPKDDRPREKLLRKTPTALTDSELLAILIREGTRNKTALDLAKEILQLGKNNLNELGKLTLKELMRVKGIGEAKAITIAAALELGRRRQHSIFLEKKKIKYSRDIAHYLQSMLADLTHEVFAVIFLNRANRINHFEIISKGGLTGTVADPRVIMRKALEEEAVHLILCHNHPSGSLRPSTQDEELTAKLKAAAKLFDMKILDHLIVSEAGYFSFADEGIL